MADRQSTLPGWADEVPAEPDVHCTDVAAPDPLFDPPSLVGQTVWVVDANSLIFQVFHAIPEMTSPRGEPVNAVFGFTRDLLYLIEQKRPNYLLVAFDLAGPTFRHAMFEAYKGTRSEMPIDLSPQFDQIRRVTDALGIPILEREGFEADDILATVARIAEEQGGECFVVTGDKDCRQLITERVRVYNVRKDQLMDRAGLFADWGIEPQQVVDYQAMVGDSVDNVPGVPQIGPKAAKELLEKYGTLDSILEHAHEVNGAKRRENLQTYREQALLSRDLVRLDAHVPVEIDWARGRVGSFHIPRLVELFGEFGFKRFPDQVRALAARLESGELGSSPTSITESAEGFAPELDRDTPQPAEVPRTFAPWTSDYRLVATPEQLAALVAGLAGQKRVSLDTETTHLGAMYAELVGISLGWREGEAYYVPVMGPPGESHLELSVVLEALRPMIEDPTIEKIGQNIKYDVLVLRRVGVHLAGPIFDTMVASYLLEAGERNHNLDELAERYLNHKTIKISELIGTGKQQRRMNEVPLETICQYAAEDADVALRLAPILEAGLREAGLDRLYRDVEMPLISILAELEFNGIRIDVARLRALSDVFGERITRTEAEIYELAGHEFNIASPKQLQQVLFQEQGLPALKRTKTGPSTDVEVLEELALLHALPKKIIEYRQYSKLKNTYVDSLPELVSPHTNRVHASFHQAVAATGRLSSSDPNLQNIPIRTESGRDIRSAFLPRDEGWQLLAADYSQIELRVLAHYSGDKMLSEAFARDEDIHTLVASQVHEVPLSEVTREMRRRAKAVNFGVIYGQSAFGLAKSLGIEQSQAAEFIEAYFARYHGVEEFLLKILAECRGKGYVNTVLGRRRAIQGVRAQSGQQGQSNRQRNLPERTAINTVIQGSAADLIKLAMIAVSGRLTRQRLATRMLLQIHDELVFEVPHNETDEVARLVVEEMQGVMSLSVPLKVDVKIGRNWAETEPLTQ